LQLNFWSCVFYPDLTRDFWESRLSTQNRTFLRDHKVDTNQSISTQVTTHLATCLVAWCDNAEGCRSSYCNTTNLITHQSLSSAGAADACLDSICAANPERVSSYDIAGIGALISIMIQLAIPFLGLLAWAVSGIALRLINARDCKSTSTFPYRRAKAKAAAESFRDTITNNIQRVPASPMLFRHRHRRRNTHCIVRQQE
jgi:hypothetical protein